MPRLNRDLKADGTKKPTKRSTSENGDFDMDALRKANKGKKSLRIDDRTVILVHRSKCNKKYAEEYKKRMNTPWKTTN